MTLLNLSRFDFLHMHPGMLMDLFHLYKARHGMLKKEPEFPEEDTE